ncbi:MAG: c-type cytochrome [Aquabacterium sp.]|nr:c-type cytochrome [Aquabacterium sp.]
MRAIQLSLILLTCGLISLLLACTEATPRAPTDAEVLQAEALRPAKPQLAAKYERSCLGCHGIRGAAPLTGFAPAWVPRLTKGPEVLLAHARDGFNGMPAKGLCSDCTDDDLRDLIQFMSLSQ